MNEKASWMDMSSLGLGDELKGCTIDGSKAKEYPAK
jgi:hypothetical protein